MEERYQKINTAELNMCGRKVKSMVNTSMEFSSTCGGFALAGRLHLRLHVVSSETARQDEWQQLGRNADQLRGRRAGLTVRLLPQGEKLHIVSWGKSLVPAPVAAETGRDSSWCRVLFEAADAFCLPRNWWACFNCWLLSGVFRLTRHLTLWKEV